MTKEAFKNLFDRYFDAVRSYLVYKGADREMATDIAQDVFMRIWEKQLPVNEKTAVGLLYKIAGDMFISKYRHQMLETNYLNAIRYNIHDMSPEDQIRYDELKVNLAKALASLNEKQRTVFLMARLDGLKYHEIAERLNISVKAVEKRMSNTLAFLKNYLSR